tara:strand:- start:1072 stop:1626 length:555 start_codon:yes stop_codon:yes gene_type:complete
MKISASVLGMLMTFSAAVQAADRTYAGLQDREIKALSSQQIGDLREGRGMGMALAAELNNYPGPRHVLDLADALGLSTDQQARVSVLFDEMAAQARALGAQILAAEARLNRQFAEKRVNDDGLRHETGLIARLAGDLRYVHLRYHLKVRALMSDIQVSRYAALRGYGEAAGGHDAGHGTHGMHR